MEKNKESLSGSQGRRPLIRELVLATLVILTYHTTLNIRNYFHIRGDRPYSTVQQVYEDLPHKKKILGLEGVIINLGFDDKILSEMAAAYTRKNKDGSYDIVLQGACGPNILRHELFHVYQWETRPQHRNWLAQHLREWEAQNYVDGLIKINPR